MVSSSFFGDTGRADRAEARTLSDRLVRALSTQLRSIHEEILGEVELWSKSAASQLDAQMRERRRNFTRRIEAINRIQQAASGLEERIQEVEQQGDLLNQMDTKLSELTDYLIAAYETVKAPTAPDLVIA